MINFLDLYQKSGGIWNDCRWNRGDGSDAGTGGAMAKIASNCSMAMVLPEPWTYPPPVAHGASVDRKRIGGCQQPEIVAVRTQTPAAGMRLCVSRRGFFSAPFFAGCAHCYATLTERGSGTPGRFDPNSTILQEHAQARRTSCAQGPYIV